jgi:hypothetical protein
VRFGGSDEYKLLEEKIHGMNPYCRYHGLNIGIANTAREQRDLWGKILANRFADLKVTEYDLGDSLVESLEDIVADLSLRAEADTFDEELSTNLEDAAWHSESVNDPEFHQRQAPSSLATDT